MASVLDAFGRNISKLSINEAYGMKAPEIKFDNPSVRYLERPEKGVYFFESNDPVDDEIMLLSAGIHGDELAGVEILDALRYEILSGSLKLAKHVCFVDGNLKAMAQALRPTEDDIIPSSRYWASDKKFGLEANANRMWIRDLLEKLDSYESYSGQRRVEIWKALKSILLGGSDTSEFSGKLFHKDLHQSFSVPKVKDVRGCEYHDDSEYTYGMAYETDKMRTIKLFRKRFGDVYAGLVRSNPEVAETFAAITAREFGSASITAELGTIGGSDSITYADKMLHALRLELQGMPRDLAHLPLDVWNQQRSIIRHAEEFGFHGDQGLIVKSIPDFVPTNEKIWIQNGDESFILDENSSILFANNDVVIGDRAGVVIEKEEA